MIVLLLVVGRLANKVRLSSFKRDLVEKEKLPTDVKILGFFHPFCDAGGGGEKVLF